MNNLKIKKIILLIVLVVTLFALLLFVYLISKPKPEIESVEIQNVKIERQVQIEDEIEIIQKETEPTTDRVKQYNFILLSPIDRHQERVTKKPFGIYITKDNSPVQSEKFTGYHTGVDFEIFSDEVVKDVPVKVVCDGKIVGKYHARGYGGLIAQECIFDDVKVTIIYGHLSLGSISAKEGNNLVAGQTLGMLGQGNTIETDGERKHLHFGIALGNDRNLRGYVNTEEELVDWLNPMDYIE